MVSRAFLAEVFWGTLLATGIAVAFGYALAVLSWPSVRRGLWWAVRWRRRHRARRRAHDERAV